MPNLRRKPKPRESKHSNEATQRLENMLHWDVNNGVARRAWARNSGAVAAIQRAMKDEPRLVVTLPNEVDSDLLEGQEGWGHE